MRVQLADEPDPIAELHAHARREGLTLTHVFTDRYEDGAEQVDRHGFSALVDALRRPDVYGVLLPSLDHLSPVPVCATPCARSFSWRPARGSL